MNLNNKTKLQVAWFAACPRPPAFAVTIIVKGAFRLAPGGSAQAIDNPDAARPTGEQYVDNNREASLRYDGDFALFKPRTDLLVVGTCYAPDQTATKSCNVSIGIGDRKKTLRVIGDRIWLKDKERIKSSGPQPFTSMPLTAENSFGGPGFEANPFGKGFEPQVQPNGGTHWALPNLEDPVRLINNHTDQPAPVGFGPLPITAPQRQSNMGTCDKAWLEKRWPGFPADFDWGHFNAAPPDQQLNDYLKGDELLTMENLHPQHSVYQCQLPGLRPRCFLNREHKGADIFVEVDLNLDTVWVDADAEQMNLVWRGRIEVKSPEHPELQDLLLITEKLTEPPGSLDTYRPQLLKPITGASTQVSNPVGLTPASLLSGLHTDTKEGDDDAVTDDESFSDQALAGKMSEALDEMKSELAKAGIPAVLLDMLSEGGDPTLFTQGLTDHLGLNTADGEKFLAEARERSMQELRDSGLDPSIIEELDALSSREDEDGNVDNQASSDKPGENTTNEQNFSGEDLTGADFSGQSLSCTDFSHAILSNANFSSAQLTSANFSGANLSGADLSEANLGGANLDMADLQGANLTRTTLNGASLKGANLSNATLEGAKLIRVEGKGALFVAANLAHAVLQFGVFDGASFKGACLDGMKANSASFRQAIFIATKGSGVILTESDLTEVRAGEKCHLHASNLRQIKADGSQWAHAILSDCDFSYASLRRADFNGASLERAKLHAIEASQSIFRKANLAKAVVTQANLFESSFERADLRETDFSESNLYGSEFWNAALEGTALIGANVKMTKLATAETN
ncbi:MAG: hypothetical protein ACI9US_001162 [Gammaproteobacteria bacterium]|jgi:uncharacterized protein YjbI with pentapeptide repeats